MDKTLREISCELTMTAHTKIMHSIINNCYQLVAHNYDILSPIYEDESAWWITVAGYNTASDNLRLFGGDDIVYMFPDDDALENFHSAGRSIDNFKSQHLYYVTPFLTLKDGPDSDMVYDIEDYILLETPIDDTICRIVDDSSLRLIINHIDRENASKNGLTASVLILAANMKRLFSIAMSFYDEVLSPVLNKQEGAHIEDALAITAWANQISLDLQQIPVGKVRIKDNSIHDVYIAMGAASSIIHNYNGNNMVQTLVQPPALYIK